MFQIKFANENDKLFWYTRDKHMSEKEFYIKVRDKQGYVIYDDEQPIGIMRYTLFFCQQSKTKAPQA